MMNSLLFVYGTLNPYGDILSQMDISFEIRGNGHIMGTRIPDKEYPSVVPSIEGREEVINGIIIDLLCPDVDMMILDDYENYYINDVHNSMYVRTQTRVTLENGESEMCWIYWYNVSSKN